MTNEYEVAAVVELGKAADIVLGEKPEEDVLDGLSHEFGQRYIPATDD